MKKLLILLFLVCYLACRSQVIDSNYVSLGTSIGIIYVPDIEWTSSNTDDSVFKIFIEGDTMAVIRNLLNYCLQEKNENDNASTILSMLNLDVLKKIVNNKHFTHYVGEYVRIVADNEKKRAKILKDIHVIKTN